MRIFLSTCLYIVIIFSFLQNWLWLTAVAVVLFSFKYGAVTFIPLAILIDGYFGHFYAIPYLSVCAVWWFMFVEYVRPKMVNFHIFSA